MEIKKFPKSKFYIILKNKRAKLNFWKPRSLDGQWKIIGQKMDTGTYDHDSGIFAARNVYGKPLSHPESLQGISRITGYKRHMDQDRGFESNLTIFRLKCSKGYNSLGDISSYDPEFDHSKYGCLSDEFLTKNVSKIKIFSFTNFDGNQMDFHELKGESSVQTDFYTVSDADEQNSDNIGHLLKNSPESLFFSYNIQGDYETTKAITLQPTSTTTAFSTTEAVETTTYSTQSTEKYTTEETTDLITEATTTETIKYSTHPSVKMTKPHKSMLTTTQPVDQTLQPEQDNLTGYDYTGLTHEYGYGDGHEYGDSQTVGPAVNIYSVTVDNRWGEVIKNHVMIKSKLYSEVTQQELCEYKCEDDSRCAGWSSDPTFDEYQCFLLRPSMDETFEISAEKDALIKIEKSGDASSCIVGEKMKADISDVKKYVESESASDCKVLCERVDNSECWLWIFRETRCHLIPVTILRISVKAFNEEYQDTIGFPNCGKEEDSLSEFLYSQTDTLETKEGCDGEEELGFLIAFLVCLFCFLLLLLYVIYQRRKEKMYEIAGKKSAGGLLGGNADKAGLHNLKVSHDKSKKKKSRQTIFTRSNLPLILSLNHPHDNSVNTADANTFNEVLSEERKNTHVGKENEVVNSSLQIQEAKVTEAFENPQLRGNGEFDKSNTEEYVKFETMLQQSAAQRYSNQAISGRTSSIISFNVGSPTLYHIQDSSLAHSLDLATTNKNEVSNDQDSYIPKYFESSSGGNMVRRKSSVVSVTHQPKLNSLSRSYKIDESVGGSGQRLAYSAKVLNSSDHESSLGPHGLSTFAMKYGFIPIERIPQEITNEVKEEETSNEQSVAT